jgi:hypothetical protein
MLARGYFQLVDAIAAVGSDAELADLRARVTATPMHPFEHRALERRLREAELTVLELEGL